MFPIAMVCENIQYSQYHSTPSDGLQGDKIAPKGCKQDWSNKQVGIYFSMQNYCMEKCILENALQGIQQFLRQSKALTSRQRLI